MQFKILHLIESLERGGAELLFTNYINNLPASFINIVVYMRPPHTLRHELANCQQIYCLNYKSKKDIPAAVFRLTKIVTKHEVQLVHSHLYWPTIIARLALRNSLPLVFSIHTTLSHDAFKPNILSKYLERLTYSKKQTAIFVSKAVLEDYRQYIPLGKKHRVIYNFVRDEFFSVKAKKEYFSNAELKLVTLCNLRNPKNLLFLIACIGELQSLPVTLDIYGEGPLRLELEIFIEEYNILNVNLLGTCSAPENILKNYDAFILTSLHEGFCLAMVEAMAVGLPCIVSDIEVLREVSGGTQLYVDPTSKEDILNKILMLYHTPALLLEYSENSRKVATRYTAKMHLEELSDMYFTLLY